MKAFNNFVVTGMGRSGTKFLASALDTSPTWSVYHERTRAEPRDIRTFSVRRFRRNNYGEVNSRLRYIAAEIPVSTHGVIIRNPQSLWLSMYNRQMYWRQVRPSKARLEAYNPAEFAKILTLLDGYIQRGFLTVRFEYMTTDIEYIRRVAERLGITDTRITEDMFRQPINQVPFYTVKSMEDIDKALRRTARDSWRWFEEKYYGGEDTPVPNSV
jgi:hypothetical protein